MFENISRCQYLSLSKKYLSLPKLISHGISHAKEISQEISHAKEISQEISHADIISHRVWKISHGTAGLLGVKHGVKSCTGGVMNGWIPLNCLISAVFRSSFCVRYRFYLSLSYNLFYLRKSLSQLVYVLSQLVSYFVLSQKPFISACLCFISTCLNDLSHTFI